MVVVVKNLFIKALLFLLVLLGGTDASLSQCIGDTVLPIPNTTIPVFELADFAPEAVSAFNSNISPVSLPVIGDLLAPIELFEVLDESNELEFNVGGFSAEMSYWPTNQALGFLGGLEQLLTGVKICDLEAMRKIKPKLEDIKQHIASEETTTRVDHAISQYNKFVADPEFWSKVSSDKIPNKGGASIGSVISTYIDYNVELALDMLLPKQFSEPINMVFPDPEISCMPKFESLGCAPLPICLPVGAAYNHIESTYNVHRAGHQALIPDILVGTMMDLIKKVERGSGEWLPFAATVLNKMDTHGYWNSRNPYTFYNSAASALLMAVQDPHTIKMLKVIEQVQDKSGLLIPSIDDSFSVSSLPSVLRTGSIPGFGTLPIIPVPLMSSQLLAFVGGGGKIPFPIHPWVRTQYHEYERGAIQSDDINPRKYFDVRSMVTTMTSTDYEFYKEPIENFYTLHAGILKISQAEQFDPESIYRYHRLPKNIGGGLMKDKNAKYGNKKQTWTNPLGPNGCVTIRGRAQYPETTFTNSTARFMCEVNQAIRVAQRECKNGESLCPDARDDYWPNKFPPPDECQSDQSYSLFPDPETECIYDKYFLHNTEAKGVYNGSVLPENMYPLDEEQMLEKESPIISHLHRQRDCMDHDVARIIFGGDFCGWVRCPDLQKFEPASNCFSTSRYRPELTVPIDGCLALPTTP